MQRVSSRKRQSAQRETCSQNDSQVGTFRMPDTPPKKPVRGQKSPDRIPCPLVPGTPVTPPKRKLHSWPRRSRSKWSLPAPPSSNASSPSKDIASLPSKDIASLPSRATSPVLSDQGTPPQEQAIIIPTQSTGVDESPTSIDDTANSTVDAVFEFIEFSPSTSFGAEVIVNTSGPSPSHEVFSKDCVVPLVFDEMEQLEMDQEVKKLEINPISVGSDSFMFDWEGVNFYTNSIDFGAVRRRLVHEFPANTEDINPKLLELISNLDCKDDRHLRQLASDDMFSFNWDSNPEVFTGQREKFLGEAGPTFNTEGMTPFELFQRIWDVSIINHIVRETNRYARQMLENPNLTPFARLKNWYDVTPEELWTFFGIIMLQSIMSISVEKEYWTPSLPYMQLGNFPSLMTYSRFVLIKRCLHFVDNTQLSSIRGPPRLAKVMPIIDHLNQMFSSLYMPEQNIVIDESLLLWKGRLSWAQVIIKKAAQVGIKSYELCESRTGYLWKIIVYTGKGTQPNVDEHDARDDTEPEGATSKIVYDLMRPLLNKGHTLVMDNFYNSPLLSRTLKRKKTDTMGTLRLNRQFVPNSLRQNNQRTMSRGDVQFTQTNDMTIIVWRDVNVVSLISTYHKVQVGGKEKHGQYKYKPQVVLDYNLSMGGVDKKDQILQAYPVERTRNLIWYKKLFRRLFNVSIHNAYVMYNARAQQKVANRQFRVRLADEIVQKFRTPSIQPPPSLGHYPARNSSSRSRCKLCYRAKISRRTAWKCETCNISLCLPDCFKSFHLNL